MQFTGMEPGIPGLVGLRAAYVSAQLGAFRYGTRSALEPDCMQKVAARLIEDDVKAVAALSRLAAGLADRFSFRRSKGAGRCPLRAAANLQRDGHAQRPHLGQFKVLIGLAAILWSAAPGRRRTAASNAEQVKRGEYLARAGDCIARHTAPTGKPFAGGLPMPTPFGTLYSTNITPDRETGIGKITADDFYRVMHVGRMPDGGLLYPAMPFSVLHQGHARADSDAIFVI